MESPDKRRVDYGQLHPLMRDKVKLILKKLNADGHPFELFEAYRTPARQRHLYEIGRTRELSRGKVTNARPWQSFHQYGLAVDIVLKLKSGWSWDTSGKNAAGWALLQKYGAQAGLRPVSWEKPHLEWAGGEIEDLIAGRYPDGGDDSWADNLEAVMAGWRANTGELRSPPEPVGIVSRPALGPDAPPDAPVAAASQAAAQQATVLALPPPIDASAGRQRFERAQLAIKEYEGKFSNDPDDPGGPTNFGITHRTLAAWRGVAFVSAPQVRDMPYSEALDIYFARYWSVMRCSDLPGPMALAVYNIGVHCGTGTSANYLQRALNSGGAGLKIDGDIGPATLTAVSACEQRQVTRELIDLYMTRLRGHPKWSKYGDGFTNRVAKLRKAVDGWFDETDAVAQSVPVPASTQPQIELSTKSVSQPPATQAGQATMPETSTAPAPLTPINAALGETVGRWLDGRKTGLGIMGTLLIQILQTSGVAAGAAGGPLGMLPPVLGATIPYAQPILLALLAWGGLGKVDKWVNGISQAGGTKPVT